MHQWALFWKHFLSERINYFQKLLKSSERYFYLSLPSFWVKLGKKKIFLIKSQILGLLVNTLTVNCEYSRSNRDNLPLPTQITLSKKEYTFCDIFFCIFGIYMKFRMTYRKYEPHQSSISEVIESKICA